MVGHYIFVFATGTRFSTDQWSAAGGWVGGLATFAAVVVALWQTKLARDDAAGAKNEADERLRKELENADERHTAELDYYKAEASQRREDDLQRQQYDAIRTILTAATNALTVIANYNDLAETHRAHAQQFDDISTETILSERASTLRTMNTSMIDISLAVLRLQHPLLRRGALRVRSGLEDAVGAVSGPSIDQSDWSAALAKAQDMNIAQRDLQAVASPILTATIPTNTPTSQ
ncbi:hypothetical protein ACWEK5_40455 [Rhodococcus koreensis]